MDISSNDSSFFPFFSNQLAGHGWLALLASLSRSSLNRKLAWLARSTRHARVAGRLCLFFFFTLSIAHSLACFPLYHTIRQVAWYGSFCSWLLSLGCLASLLGMARFVLGFFRRFAWLPRSLGCLANLLAWFVFSWFLWLGWLASSLGMARFVLGFSRLLARLASLGLAGSPACLLG